MEKLNVAVADDNERMVEVLGQIIEEDKDLELVGKAHNGEEICNIIREKEPDVVVLDIIMPKMDGLAVMEKFAHDKSLKKAPAFIVVSAVGQERITEDAFSLGADYYILKPFDNKMLLNRIKHARRAGERRMREISRQTERTEEKQVPVRNLETDERLPVSARCDHFVSERHGNAEFYHENTLSYDCETTSDNSQQSRTGYQTCDRSCMEQRQNGYDR